MRAKRLPGPPRSPNHFIFGALIASGFWRPRKPRETLATGILQSIRASFLQGSSGPPVSPRPRTPNLEKHKNPNRDYSLLPLCFRTLVVLKCPHEHWTRRLAPGPGKGKHRRGKREGPEERKPLKGREGTRGATQKPGNQDQGPMNDTFLKANPLESICVGKPCRRRCRCGCISRYRTSAT